MMETDLTIASTPRKIKNTIHSSISRTVGKKLATTLKDELNNAKMYAYNELDILFDNIFPTLHFFVCFYLFFSSSSSFCSGPRFELIASATLTLSEASDLPHTHDLQLISSHTNYASNNNNNNQTNNNKLPLFGHFCCRLAVQPDFLSTSYLASDIQLLHPHDDQLFSGYARLQAFQISCWDSLEAFEAKSVPAYAIDVTRDTKIKRRSEAEFIICNMIEGINRKFVFHAKDSMEASNWELAIKRAIKEHILWKHVTLNTPMEIPVPGSDRCYLSRSSRHGSLYDQVPISSTYRNNKNHLKPKQFCVTNRK